MNIIISHTSMEPIYEQIVRQIRAKIIDGSLKEKEPLPSVRTLSRGGGGSGECDPERTVRRPF